ncbi:MAG: polysaccharide deacetylase family protein [Sphingobium sp.]
MTSKDTCPVLTYHSISDAGGPTSIPPAVFAMQMEVLAASGYHSLAVADFIAWHEGRRPSDRSVLITFDDGFLDFAQVAAPILKQHGLTAVVFVPTAKLGGDESWALVEGPGRPLMNWDQVRALGEQGMEFGGHSRTHANLAKLDEAARMREIADCKTELAAQIGAPGTAFAAPYGAVNADTISAISRHYDVAFGTRLALARRGADRHDIPRIDMHYFRERRHWQGLLDGGTAYLRARQGLRILRERLMGAHG